MYPLDSGGAFPVTDLLEKILQKKYRLNIVTSLTAMQSNEQASH